MNEISDQTRAIWMLENRTRGSTLGAQLRRNVKGYAQLFAVNCPAVVLLALLESVVEIPFPATIIVVSFACGAFLRDFAWFGALRRQWPFLERIADWNEVQRIAGGQPPA